MTLLIVLLVAGGVSDRAPDASAGVRSVFPNTTKKPLISIILIPLPYVVVNPKTPTSPPTSPPTPPPCGTDGGVPCNPCANLRSCPVTTAPRAVTTVPVVIILGGDTTTTAAITTTTAPFDDSVRMKATGASFGEVGVGTSSAPRAVTLSNQDTIPIRLTKVSVPAPFVIVPGGTCSSLPFLGAGASCTYQVVLRPVAPGPQSATVAIEVLPPGGTVVVPATVDGVGTAARLEFNPATLDLGQGAAGEKSTGTALLRNTGSSPIRVAKVALLKPGSEVVVGAKPCVGATLPPGGSCTVTINVTPKAGVRSFELFATGSRGESAILKFTRRGLRNGFTLTPPVVDFGILATGATSPPKRFTVKNIGEIPLTLVPPILQGPNVSEVRIIATTCGSTPLGLKATCTIDVVASATTPGAKSAALKVSASTKLVKTSALRARVPGPTTSALPNSGTTSAPTPITALPVVVDPTLRMNPAVGSTGRVTFAEGRGFPANAEVELRWSSLGAVWRVRTDGTGEFRLPVLVRSGEPIGGRIMTVVDQPGVFAGVQAPFLVQLPTFRPSGERRHLDR